jgi:hypothetical protein
MRALSIETKLIMVIYKILDFRTGLQEKYGTCRLSEEIYYFFGDLKSMPTELQK